MDKNIRAAALLALFWGGCYNPDLGALRFSCVEDDQCPEGYSCVAGCCGGMCPACGMSLSSVGTGDFAVAFRVTTRTATASALLFQRAACTSGDFWDVQISAEGYIKLKINDARMLTGLTGTATLNDGRPHAVLLRRAALGLSLWVDGVTAGGAYAPQNLGPLPPLGIATGDPCTGPLDGTITDICLTKMRP